MPRHTSGSPPVRRIFRIPMDTASQAISSISSRERISRWSRFLTPSGGMQYAQRRLHKSVSEMRR